MSEHADTISLPLPDDFHAHFRRGPLMAAYVRRHAECFGRALAMPNTLPPVASGAELAAYRSEILGACQDSAGFEALMTFKLLPGMDAASVRDCVAAGAVAGKYYPAGATTNSTDGLPSPESAEEALAEMESLGIVLSVHAEDPSAPVFEREEAFLPVMERIMVRHPRLKVVFEHVSGAAGMRFVLQGPERLGATVTAAHLLFTREDLLADGMKPHLYCKPILKSAADRDALREAVFSGAPRLFFGSDSAPHPRAAKERASAASGIYSAPTALSALAGLFDEEGAADRLGDFVGAFGARFYGLPEPSGRILLERAEWTAPAETDGAVPMLAGCRLAWRVRR